MNLPKVIEELIKAQNSFDSEAYTTCFSETGMVYDEGKTHRGRKEIRDWITKSNENYKSVMEPLEFHADGMSSVLTTRVSGTFDGSPIVLKFHFELAEDKIRSLKITG